MKETKYLHSASCLIILNIWITSDFHGGNTGSNATCPDSRTPKLKKISLLIETFLGNYITYYLKVIIDHFALNLTYLPVSVSLARTSIGYFPSSLYFTSVTYLFSIRFCPGLSGIEAATSLMTYKYLLKVGIKYLNLWFHLKSIINKMPTWE